MMHLVDLVQRNGKLHLTMKSVSLKSSEHGSYLLKGHNAIPCSAMFKEKHSPDSKITLYPVWIVIGGHRQVEGVNYSKTFFSAAKMPTIQWYAKGMAKITRCMKMLDWSISPLRLWKCNLEVSDGLLVQYQGSRSSTPSNYSLDRATKPKWSLPGLGHCQSSLWHTFTGQWWAWYHGMALYASIFAFLVFPLWWWFTMMHGTNATPYTSCASLCDCSCSMLNFH